MIFTETPIKGAYLIDLDKREDPRGFFARFFCQREFAEHGLETNFVQINNSLSRDQGTLRGLHYQLGRSAEVKVLRVLSGALWDVIVDLRPESATFGRHFGVELSAANRTMLYVPRRFAHGFLTLEPDTETLYLVSAFYDPEAERGLRYNDPKLAIDWPAEPKVISDKDRAWPDLDQDYHLKGL